MLSTGKPTRRSFLTYLFLMVAVPSVILILLELGCRIFSLDGSNNTKQSHPELLAMPTWMLREDNVRARVSIERAVDKDALEWMGLFVEGDGFRVHLLPSISRQIKNTFSRIPADQERRYSVRTNSLGFRSAELLSPKPTGTYRILVFGDSSSFGWGVDQEQMYSALLAEQLAYTLRNNEIYTTIEVGNFSIPGDSSEYGRLIFEKFAARYEPDLVILGFGANDAKKVITPHKQQVDRFKEDSSLYALRSALNRSALVRTLAALITPRKTEEASGAPTKPLSTAVSRKRYQANLAAMGESARAMGAESLLITLCTPQAYRRAAARVADNRSFLYLDGQSLLLETIPALSEEQRYPQEVQSLKRELGPLLTREKLFYVSSDGCHPNAIGHKIVAEALTTRILPLLSKVAT